MGIEELVKGLFRVPGKEEPSEEPKGRVSGLLTRVINCMKGFQKGMDIGKEVKKAIQEEKEGHVEIVLSDETIARLDKLKQPGWSYNDVLDKLFYDLETGEKEKLKKKLDEYEKS